MTTTNESLCRIVAAYMPCMATFCKEPVYIIGVSWGEHEVTYTDLSEGKIDWDSLPQTLYDIEGLRLILTPLQNITNEDAIEVAKILIPQCFQRRTKDWVVSRDFTITGYPYIKIHHKMITYTVQIDPILVNFDVDNMEDRETGAHNMKPAAIIDYLRSKSYDCGYGNIESLIKDGIATIKAQNDERSVATDAPSASRLP